MSRPRSVPGEIVELTIDGKRYDVAVLVETVGRYLGDHGPCDQAECEEECPLCHDPGCSFCEMARAAGDGRCDECAALREAAGPPGERP